MTDKTDLAGLTPMECPYACNPTSGCVITGSICGHPFKGGLQGALQAKPEVVARFQKARAMLHNKKIGVNDDGEQKVVAAQKPARRKRKKRAKGSKKPPVAEAAPPPASKPARCVAAESDGG